MTDEEAVIPIPASARTAVWRDPMPSQQPITHRINVLGILAEQLGLDPTDGPQRLARALLAFAAEPQPPDTSREWVEHYRRLGATPVGWQPNPASTDPAAPLPTPTEPVYLITAAEPITADLARRDGEWLEARLGGRVIVLQHGMTLYTQDENGNFVAPPVIEGPVVQELIARMAELAESDDD